MNIFFDTQVYCKFRSHAITPTKLSEKDHIIIKTLKTPIYNI